MESPAYVAYTLPWPTGAVGGTAARRSRGQGRSAERLGAHGEAHRSRRGTGSRLGSNGGRIVDRTARDRRAGIGRRCHRGRRQRGLEAEDGRSSVPIRPSARIAHRRRGPVAGECHRRAESRRVRRSRKGSPRRPRATRRSCRGWRCLGRFPAALVLEVVLRVTHDRIDPARGQRDGRAERHRARRGGERCSVGPRRARSD